MEVEQPETSKPKQTPKKITLLASKKGKERVPLGIMKDPTSWKDWTTAKGAGGDAASISDEVPTEVPEEIDTEENENEYSILAR